MKHLSIRCCADRRSLVVAVTVLALALTACGGGDAGSSPGGPRAGEAATTFHHIHGLGVDKSGGLYVATHAGLIRGTADKSWNYVSADRNDHMGFTLDPMSGTMFRSGHPVTGGSLGVESSPDGDAWQKLSDVLEPPVDFHAMTVSQADGKTVFGWDAQSSKTLRSLDGGRTWQELSMKGTGSSVFSFAAPPTVGVVLAGTPSGLFRSTDQGASWNRLSSIDDGYVVSVAADPNDANHVLASTERGVKITRDGGATWTPSLGGIPPRVAVTSLAISPVDGEVAYAADALTIFKTVDGGKHWTVVRSEP
jgi:photosystem II stability/assembly factor-like uncharacterized protein